MVRGKRPVLGPAHELLGERLKALRTLSGYKMRDLEDAGVVSKAHLSELENGQVTPSAVKLGRLVAHLGGNQAEFSRLMVAIRTENEERKRANARRRGELYIAGLASPLAVTANFVLKGKPEIRVVDPGAAPRVVEVAGASSVEDVDFSLPVVVEEAEDDYTVGTDRIIGSTILSRTIRATADDVQTYRWWFTEAPAELVLRTVTLGVSVGGVISKVWQLGRTSYGVEIVLSKPLNEGERARLRYYKVIEALGYCSRWIRRVQAVDLVSSRLAVKFDGSKPTHVWQWSNLPAGATPGLYNPNCELQQQITGQYEQYFKAPSPGMTAGLAWQFDGDES